MSRKRTVLVSAAILVAGAVIAWLIFQTEPTAERSGSVREGAMLVEVVSVERGTHRPVVRAMGTVEPARDVVLAPRVGGRIVRVADGFTPGGTVRAGEPLLQIDPADYRHVLAQRRGDLSQAQSDLEVERGRQTVARRDYELLGDTIRGEDRALVLREPQLEAARSRVEAARAAVDQAALDLERTTVRAPFDAHVLTRQVNLGSEVGAGDALGRVVGLDTYWVVATVPQSRVRWLRFADAGQDPSPVRIRNRTAWEPGEIRSGSLHRLVGALDEQTRLARVIIEVPDPLSYRTGAGGPPLMIGSYVEAEIEAEPLADVVRLDRDYLRDDDTVWVMEDGALRIRDVDVVFRDPEHVYIAGGLETGERVVVTNLATVVEGAPLRRAADAAVADTASSAEVSP